MIGDNVEIWKLNRVFIDLFSVVMFVLGVLVLVRPCDHVCLSIQSRDYIFAL